MRKALLMAICALLLIGVLAGCSAMQTTGTANAGSAELTTDTTELTTPRPSRTQPVHPTQEGAPEVHSPTTGMEGTTGEYKPVIVQIDNEPPARPQAGPQWADIVYETMIEGIDTRLTCIFNDILWQEDSPKEVEVGPVRSSRYYHQWIQGEWDALYVHQGGAETPDKESFIWGESSEHIEQRINGAGKRPSNAELIFRRKNTGKNLEQTAYTELHADAAIYSYEPIVRRPFKYYPLQDYADEQQIEKIELSFWSVPGWVEYQYDSTKDKLLRFMKNNKGSNSTEFIAEETGEQVEVQNLIVQYVPVSDFPNEKGRKQIDVFGEGEAEYVIHGKHIKGTWSRENKADAPTMYYDENGEEITLAPGNTWIAMHPNDRTVVTTYEDGTTYTSNEG